MTALAGREALVARLAAGHVLAKPEHEALARVAKLATGKLHTVLAAKLDEKQTPDENVDGAVDAMKQTGTLEQILVQIFDEPGVSASVIFEVCHAHPKEAMSVLRDEALIAGLRKQAPSLAPSILFPSVALSQLAATPAFTWAMETEPAAHFLRDLDPKITERLIVELLADRAGHWLASLPRGRALQANERKHLHELALRVPGPKALRMFQARFNVDVANLEAKMIAKMWPALELVPDSHITQRSVDLYVGFDAAPSSGTAGEFDEGADGVKEIQARRGLDDFKATETPYSRGDDASMLTEAEAIQVVGGKEHFFFDEFVRDGKLVLDKGSSKFELVGPSIDRLTDTTLHELGHAVDHMLGGRTELIFDLVGWRTFPESQFDDWATDLGGWGGVSAPDQKLIREAWISYMSSSHDQVGPDSVKKLVASDHPAVADRYIGVGVVDLARKDARPNLYAPAIVDDKAVVLRHESQLFQTLSINGLRAAPSSYALTGPGEYFAECYAKYYATFDGKDATTKGSMLVPWIKGWMDANVDNVGFNPKFKGEA